MFKKPKIESYTSLYPLVKKILGKKYLAFKKILDKKEKAETLKYILTSNLKLKKLEVESKVMKKNEFSFARERLLSVDPKINYFSATMKKKDYISVLKFLEAIEKDV